jgi:two-component system, chemotaxis family, chemotaxis protein CheY
MPSILIVDDEPDLLTILAMLYEMQGFTVYSAKDGEHALDVIRQNPVEIVLTDLMMPRLDGLGLSRRLRELPEYKDVPIILHTAAGAEVAGLGTCYDLLVPKPSAFEDQLAAVETLLARGSRRS